jgi:hypothetical protein
LYFCLLFGHFTSYYSFKRQRLNAVNPHSAIALTAPGSAPVSLLLLVLVHFLLQPPVRLFKISLANFATYASLTKDCFKFIKHQKFKKYLDM